MHRDTFLLMPLNELLRACTLKGYQGSGPGGQHRNKTNTGVCLKLNHYNLEIKSSESRSACENKTHALHRMQMALALEVREEPLPPEKLKFPGSQGRIQTSNPLFPLFIAQVLDIVYVNKGDTKPAALAFNLTPTALTRILHLNKGVVEKIRIMREAGGKRKLRI